MSLIKCAKCSHMVSDRGTKCPKCGTPIQKSVAIEKARKKENIKYILVVCTIIILMIILTIISLSTTHGQKQKTDSSNLNKEWYENNSDEEWEEFLRGRSR